MNNNIKELTDFLDKHGVKYEVVGDRVVANEVHLGTRGITQLPASIGHLRCEYLSLLDNELTSLPESIGNLKCKELYLSNNNLTAEAQQLLEKLKSAGFNVIY